MKASNLLMVCLPLFVGAVVIKSYIHIPDQPLLKEVEKTLPCTRPLVFQKGYEKDEGGVQFTQQGYNLQGISWLEAQVCEPGVLELIVEGDVAGGEAPRLEVALNSELLTGEYVDGRSTLRIHVPGSGRLTLGYFNDYYQAEVRVATLNDLTLQSDTCQSFNVDVPQSTGGQWLPDPGQATLVLNAPMKVTPCAGGRFAVNVSGREGLGQFPLLKFVQAGRTLATVRTQIKPYTLKLSITSEPLEISILNPAGRVLADRNLRIKGVKFTSE